MGYYCLGLVIEGLKWIVVRLCCTELSSSFRYWKLV